MPAAEPTAYVYLTASAEYFVRSDNGKRLVSRAKWDVGAASPGYLRVTSFKISEGWLMCWAILNDPSDPHDDMVEVALPDHAVSGVMECSAALE